jgi:hypothetical protein
VVKGGSCLCYAPGTLSIRELRGARFVRPDIVSGREITDGAARHPLW